MLNKFEIAVRYIEKHRKNHKVIFGKMDCSKNECLYGADHDELPGAYYYRAFEHHRPAGLRQRDQDYVISDYVNVYVANSRFWDNSDDIWPIDELTGDYLPDHEVLVDDWDL